jgi:hypothetical protein
VSVARQRGKLVSSTIYSYSDARLRIEHDISDPHALAVWKIGDREDKVLSVVWRDDGDAVTVLWRTGSWEDHLRRLAG